MWRAGRLYYRRRVPASLLPIVGKREVWRSLATDSPTVALRRSHEIAASIERYFEAARSQAGLPVDHRILSVADVKLVIRAEASSVEAVVSLTLREVYNTYMTDPTRDWSPRTRMAYETTRRQALSLLGGDTAILAAVLRCCSNLSCCAALGAPLVTICLVHTADFDRAPGPGLAAVHLPMLHTSWQMLEGFGRLFSTV